jgi:regulatory protein
MGNANEVARVRGMLEQLEARQRARPAPTVGSLVAWAQVGERTGSTTFSSRAGESRIAWNDAGVEGEATASRTVARPVAKAFGKTVRRFGSVEELDRWLDRLEEDALWERVVALASARERSAAGVQAKLEAEGFAPAACERAVRRAQRSGIVDDARYAAAFVRSKLRAGWGRAKIEGVLRREGVDLAFVEGYPEELFTADDEEARARALLAHRAVPAKDPVNKLVRHLVGRGFSTGVAFKAARERAAASETVAGAGE